MCTRQVMFQMLLNSTLPPTATVLNKSSGDLHSYACPWQVTFVLEIQATQSDPEFSVISERQWVQQHLFSVLKGR